MVQFLNEFHLLRHEAEAPQLVNEEDLSVEVTILKQVKY